MKKIYNKPQTEITLVESAPILSESIPFGGHTSEWDAREDQSWDIFNDAADEAEEE